MAGDPTLDVAALIEDRKLGRVQLAVILLLCSLMVLEGYDMQTLSFAAPAILKEWHVSKASFGPVLSASLFGYMLGALCLSVAGDRLGRKKIIIAGVTIFGAFTFAAGFATGMGGLLVLRLCAGLGLGGAIPTGIALAAEYTPARIRATTIGLMFVGYNIGAAIGGFFASWSIGIFGWQSVFFTGGVAAIPMALVLALSLPESIRFLVLRGGDPGRIRRIAKLLWPDLDTGNARRFTVTEPARKASPVSLFLEGRSVMTLLLWFAFIASFTGHYFLTGWLPTVLSDAGASLGEANFAAGLFQIGGAVGSFTIAYLLDRGGIRVVAVTFLIAAPIVATLGIISADGSVLLATVFFAGVTVLGGQIGLNALAGTLYPTSIRATGAGYGLGVGRIGSIAGPIVGGVLITMGTGRPVLFLLTAIPFFFCALALAGLIAATRRRARRYDEAADIGAAREFAH